MTSLLELSLSLKGNEPFVNMYGALQNQTELLIFKYTDVVHLSRLNELILLTTILYLSSPCYVLIAPLKLVRQTMCSS